jgi:hypothetical protein
VSRLFAVAIALCAASSLAALEARGFERDASGQPDFLIIHHGILDTGAVVSAILENFPPR